MRCVRSIAAWSSTSAQKRNMSFYPTCPLAPPNRRSRLRCSIDRNLINYSGDAKQREIKSDFITCNNFTLSTTFSCVLPSHLRWHKRKSWPPSSCFPIFPTSHPTTQTLHHGKSSSHFTTSTQVHRTNTTTTTPDETNVYFYTTWVYWPQESTNHTYSLRNNQAYLRVTIFQFHKTERQQLNDDSNSFEHATSQEVKKPRPSCHQFELSYLTLHCIRSWMMTSLLPNSTPLPPRSRPSPPPPATRISSSCTLSSSRPPSVITTLVSPPFSLSLQL